MILTLLLTLTVMVIAAWLFLLARDRRSPGLRVSAAIGWRLFLGSLVFGSLLYALLVLLLYQRLADYVMHRAVPPDMRAWVAMNMQAGNDTAWQAEVTPWLLESLELTEADPKFTQRLQKSLACPGDRCAAYPGAALSSALEVTTNLIVHKRKPPAELSASDAERQCGNDDGCVRNSQLAMARLLVGSLSCEDQDAQALRDPNVTCRSWPMGLSAPWQPSRVVAWMGVACQSEVADISECKAATYLLQGALDDPGTRSRQIAFGMVYGFGRWLVLVLGLGVMAALCWRRRVCRTIEDDLAQVAAVVSAGNASSSDRSKRRAQANDAWTRVQQAARSGAGTALPSPDLSRPDPLHAPTRALLFQACRSHDLSDASPVRDAALQSRQEMDGWWELLTTVVTVFPVIGLAATLNGLIHAFAQADQIAVAMGDARANAIRVMVSELSASFSTTFVALLLMSALTLWALRTRQAEQRAFTRAVEAIDDALVHR